MRLFGLDITKAADPARQIISSTQGFGWDTSLPGQWDWSAYVNAYKSWVYIAIDKIARSVAMLPLELYVYRSTRDGKLVHGHEVKLALRQCEDELDRKRYLKSMQLEKEPVTTHPWLELMQKPNAITVRFALWYDTMVKMELGGSCGWYMPKGPLGIPGAIYVLPLTSSAKLSPIPDPVTLIKGFKYEDGNLRQTFELDEVMYMRYPSPRSPIEGMSALRSQIYPYSIDDYMDKLQYYMFKNKAVPGLNLHTDQPLKGQQVEDIRTQIANTFEGAKNAGKLFVTHSGLKIGQALTPPFKELVLDKISDLQQDKILAAYDVPAGLVGLVKDVNRANMEALKESFFGETIRSKTMLIEEYIEAFMLPMYDERLTCDFRIPELSQRDLDLQERRENLDRGVTTINEERAKMQLDEVEWGDKPWMPVNRLPWEEEETDPGAPPAGPDDGKSYHSKNVVLANANTKSLDLVWKAYARQHAGYEKLLLATARKLFKRQAEETVEKMEAETVKLVNRFGTNNKSAGRQRFVKQNGLVRRIFDPLYWKKVTEEMFRPVVEYVWEDAGTEQMKRLEASTKQLEFLFNVNDPHAQQMLGDRLDKFSSEITGTTFSEVDKVLAAGWEAGLPSSVIAGNLAEMFTAAEKYRAPLISRTEATAASNAADLESVRQAGLEQDVLKVWVSSRDQAVRETHSQAEADYIEGIPMQESFTVGGDTMEAPGMGGLAEENINCRCTVAYIKRKDK